MDKNNSSHLLTLSLPSLYAEAEDKEGGGGVMKTIIIMGPIPTRGGKKIEQNKEEEKVRDRMVGGMERTRTMRGGRGGGYTSMIT